MATPLRGRDELDVPGLERLVEHLISGGISGLFILGTTGEGPSLSYRLRRELITYTSRIVRGRVKVLVGITDTAFVESVGIARHAAKAGADAVVLAPPYYIPEGQPELIEYLHHIVPELPVPVYLYNMPSLTKVVIEPDTVRRAMEEPRILGLKDSSGDMHYFNQLCSLLPQRPDWSLLVGKEELLAGATLAGGTGGVPGGANLFPRLYVALFEAAAKGDLSRAHILQGKVSEVADQLYRVGRHPSAFIKGIKCALACMAICDDFMAEPFHRFLSPERNRIAESVSELSQTIDALLQVDPGGATT